MVVTTVANNLQYSYTLLLYTSANTPQDKGTFERNLIYKQKLGSVLKSV